MDLGVQEATARTIIKTMAARSVDELANIAVGADQEGLNELKEVWSLGLGFGVWGLGFRLKEVGFGVRV